MEYLEPSINDSETIPDWLDNWSILIQTLYTQFNPINPTADAEDGVNNLKMQDNQHIIKYNIKFNHLAIRTGWNDNVFRHHYYSRLAKQIKDIMGQQGKPSTLEDMNSIDSRHWERLQEKSHSGKGKSEQSDKSDKPKSNNKNKGTLSTSSNSNKGNNSNKLSSNKSG